MVCPSDLSNNKRYGRLRKECNAGIFVMEYFTRKELRALRSVFIATILFCLAYSLSIIHELDVQQIMENYNKWGPSARTCLRLAWGTISERELKRRCDRPRQEIRRKSPRDNYGGRT